MKFGIWANVSGGITGNRSAWVKSENGNREEFTDFETAANAAREYERPASVTGARFTYRAMEIR